MQNTQKNFYKKFLGAKGELICSNFLEENGYTIIDKNYKNKIGEIDIIAKKNNEIFFVEVKTRSNLKFGTPAMAVNNKKQQKYREIAIMYLEENGCDDMPFSFMIAEVIDDKINIIENAF